MRLNRRTFWMVGVASPFLTIIASFSQNASPARTDVPMTRAEECLAVHDGIGRRGRFIELPDGRILLGTNGKLYTSSDAGMTWSEPWQPAMPTIRNRWSGEKAAWCFSRISPWDKWDAPSRSRKEDRNDCHLVLWRSQDGGKTWSRPKRITPRLGFGLFCVHDVLIRTRRARLATSGLRRRQALLYLLLRRRRRNVDRQQAGGPRSRARGPAGPNRWRRAHGGRSQTPNPSALYSHRHGTPVSGLVYGRRCDLAESLSHRRSRLPAHPRAWASCRRPETWSSFGPKPAWRTSARGFNRSRLSTAISRDQGKTWTSFQNIESSIEGTKIDPGPLNPQWAIKRFEAGGYHPVDKTIDPKNMAGYTGVTRIPLCSSTGDMALVSHTNMYYDQDGKSTSTGRIRVVPVSWFSGGPGAVR